MFDFDDLLLPAIVVFCLAILVALTFVSIDETEKWDVFKEDHHCKIVAHIDGEMFNTFGVASKGGLVVGIGSTSSKTGWLCDDGITYYK